MTTKHTLIDEAIAELIERNPDIPRVIGLLTMFRLLPSGPQVTEELPPMRPLKTKVSTLDVACPTCKAKPGKRCVRMSTRGRSGVPTDEPLVMGDGKPSNHKRRTARAQQATGTDRAVKAEP